MPSHPLQVGVVIDSLTPPAWVVALLDRLQQNPLLELAGVQVPRKSTTEPGNQAAQTVPGSLLRRLGQRILGIIDRPRFSSNPLAPEPLSDTQQALINAGPRTSLMSNKRHFDIVLYLGTQTLDVQRLPGSRLGVWSAPLDKLVALAEHALLARAPLLWINLRQLQRESSTADASWQHLASHALPLQTFSVTDCTRYAHACLPAVFESRLNWLANGIDPAAYEIAQMEIAQMPPSLTNPAAMTASALPYSISSFTYSLQAVRLFFLQSVQRLRSRLQDEQWQLAFAYDEPSNPNFATRPLTDYSALVPPTGRMWADPHISTHAGHTYVFFEDLDFRENKGRISVAELSIDGFSGAPVCALDEPYHLSYPFVFKHEDEHYMIPETAARRTVSLYKADKFPKGWKHQCNLLDDVNTADSTLLEHDGWWWLFTNGMSHTSVDERDELHIYFSRDFLAANWQSHPLNPVVTGVDRARMAGPIYLDDGQLFRPSQNGAYRYGYGYNIARIDILSPTDYREAIVSRTTPAKHDSWMGGHTFSRADGLAVIDRLRYCRR
jgi:hypothetical protein